MRLIMRVALLFCVANVCVAAPKFSQISDTKSRQAAFFAYLTPMAQKANQSILSNRDKIFDLLAQWRESKQLTKSELNWLQSLAKRYKLASLGFTDKKDWRVLLQRVDIVPTSMVLAQAANESGWGTSRFTRLGNNYFGQWCFSDGCGIVPTKRPKGKHYEVQTFNTAYESIASYMMNLNTQVSYESFRELRARMRLAKQNISGAKLAKGLTRYSERGQSYVKSIQSIISHHHLTQLDVA